VRRLAERHDVALLCLRAPDEAPVEPELRERCALVAEVPLASRASAVRRLHLLASLLRGQPLQVADTSRRGFGRLVCSVAAAWRPTVVHLEMERMARYLDDVGDAPARVLVATEAAAETARDLERVAPPLERAARALDLRAWRRYEAAALARVDALVCFTDRDARALASVAPGREIAAIPLLVELPERPLDPLGSPTPTLLFVGGFGHPPNVDAALRLATRIFPRVRASLPDAVLYLVGDKPPPQLRRLADEHTIVTGRVEDVTPYLDRAGVVVAPLRLGGGMRVKVLEALAAGKAVVASPRAADGIAAVAGEHLLVGESDEALAAAVEGLLADPEARAALGRRARAWAETALDWEQAVAAYERVYARALELASRRR
jgi:glycosyltransferase involved in cell wall biosynthesis